MPPGIKIVQREREREIEEKKCHYVKELPGPVPFSITEYK